MLHNLIKDGNYSVFLIFFPSLLMITLLNLDRGLWECLCVEGDNLKWKSMSKQMKQQMFQSRNSLLKSNFLYWGSCKLAVLNRIATIFKKRYRKKQIKKVNLHAFIFNEISFLLKFWLVNKCICGQKQKNLLQRLFSFSLVMSEWKTMSHHDQQDHSGKQKYFLQAFFNSPSTWCKFFLIQMKVPKEVASINTLIQTSEISSWHINTLLHLLKHLSGLQEYLYILCPNNKI